MMLFRMFRRKRHYRDGEWQLPHPRPHRKALTDAVNGIRSRSPIEDSRRSQRKAAEVHRDRKTNAGAVWAMREVAMDARQREIDTWIKDMRPVLSLTNLDPYAPYMFRLTMAGRLRDIGRMFDKVWCRS